MKKKFGKGFKNALLIAAMLSVGAGFGYAATNITDDDVTAAGGRYQTPSNGDYNVTTAITGHTTPGTSDKGVIYHAKTGTVYVLKNSNFSNNWAQQGGAIYTTGSGKNVVVTDANFTGNHTSQHGGALYTKGDLTINASTQDVTFSGNYVESSSYTGGAIYAERALNINATGGDIIFENNYIKTSSNKNDIFLKSSTDTKMNVNTADGHFVKFAGGITSSGNGATINKTGLGTMELAAPSTFQGTVNIQQGILKTTNGGGAGGTNTLFNGANVTTTFSDGTTISSINNAIDSTNLGNLTMDGNVNLAFDVNTTAGNTDTFSAGTITRNSDTYKFKLSAGNMNNIDSSAELSSFTKQIATGDLIALIDTVVSGKDIAGSSKSWGLGYNATTGVLTFTAEESLDIKTAINDDTHTSYTLNANETVSGNIGLMGNKSTMLIESSAGNKFTVNGNSKAGMEIGSGKSMTINNAVFSGFKKMMSHGGVILNSGTLTLNNVDFTDNTIIYGWGGAVYNNSGSTITAINGNLTNNTGAVIGGAIYNAGTIGTLGSATSTFSGNSSDRGGAINNNGTITSITGAFTNNTANDGYLLGGGAIFNSGTIGDTTNPENVAISGTFSGNTAIVEGGAICNQGTITKIADATFGSATDNTKGNTAANGGAISNDGTINSISADFYYNKSTSGSGGALYNGYTIGTLTGNFIGNTAENGNGGAIYNNGTITIKTNDTADITFSGNTDSTGSNAIHNARGTVTFDGTKNIILNDSLTSDYTSDTNQGKYVKQGTGALVLNNSMSGVSGDVEIKGGTVKIDSTEGGTFFTNAHNTTFDGTDLTLDTQDGTVNATALGTLTMNSDVAMKIDVDTNAGEGDTFSATAVSGTGEFVLSAGNIKNIGTGTEASFSYEIADSVLRSHINETVSGSEIESSAHAWAIGYSKSSGVLTFTMGSLLDIKTAINDNTHTSYTLNANETVSGNIGAMGNKSTMLIESSAGNKFTVDGNSKAGMEIGSYSGNPQSMTINNVAFDGFEKNGNGGVIHNQGTLTLNNVDFTGNSATNGSGGAIYNGGTIGDTTDLTKTAISGNFIGNTATYDGGAIYNDGGTITKISDTTFGSATDNTKGNTANYGGAIGNYGTIKSLSADFYYNKATYDGGAIYNGGTIGDTTDLTKTAISGNFIGNTATYDGGAIYNDGGTITKISDTTFGSATDNTKGNTARRGGAIYNNSGTINSISADFYYNKATYGGGAIYNLNTIGDTTDLTKTAISGTFIGNSATKYGGAIRNDGTITKISDATFGSATDNTKGNTAANGGAIYNGSTIKSISADFYYNKSTSGSGGAIYNGGTIGDTTDLTKTAISGTFIGNSATQYGGAIRNEGTNATITSINGSFENNIALGASESAGGAICNWMGTINSINANFKNNYIIADGTDILSGGGAIANSGTGSNGTINSITGNFTGNQAISSSGGGAISNTYYIGSVKGDFDGNMAGNAIYGGGAIGNIGQMTIVDSNFTNNLVKGDGSLTSTGLGGAIGNGGTMTISATGSDVTFSGNYINVDFTYGDLYDLGVVDIIKSYNLTNAIPNDIATALGGTTTLNTASGHTMTLNGGLMDDGNAHWIKTGEGTLVLKSDNSAVYGDVQIQGGTVQLTNNGAVKGTLFSNASKTTWSAGTKIDAQNGNYDTIGLGDSVELLGDVEAYIDINLAEDKTDKFVAGSAVDSSAGKIILTTITSETLKNIYASPSGVTPPLDGTMIERQIADTNVAGAIQVATDVRVNLENSSGKWILSYNGDTGVLTFNNGWTLPDAIASTANSVVYNAVADEPTLTADLGNLGGVTTSVRMNGKIVDGGGYAGVNIVTSGQELGIKDATFTNFAKTGFGGVINNTKGAVTLENVKIHDVSATNNGGAIMNDTEGSLTISGSEFYNNESGRDGGAIYNGGNTFIVSGTSSVHNNTANGNGGGIYLINQSANIGGTTFTSNTAKKRGGVDGGDGGAYYAMNATTSLTDVLFSLNKAENSGGALVNAGGTTTLTNATFTSNTADGRGGAIFNIGGGTTTVNKGQFNSNVAKEDFGGGAIFNDGDNSKVVIQNKNNSFTGNYAKQGGAIANFGSQIDVSKASFSGNKAITNSQGGGAILNNGQYRVGTLNILDSSFTNNLASNQGGAISNIGDATKAIVNITATGANITFSGNKQGVVFNADGTISDDSSAVSNAIYNEGTVTFAGSKIITLNDCITGTANSVYTKNGTGTLVLANDMSGVLGDVILNQGTVKLESGGNFFSSDSSRAKKVEVAGTGVLLDVKNNNIETVDLGNLVLTKNLKVAVDVDLANSQIDNFKTTGTITGNKSIIIDTVQANMRAINDLAASDYPKPSASGDGVEYQQRRVVTQIADTSIANKFELADHIRLDVREVIDGSSNNHDVNGDNSGLKKGWFMFYNSATGELNFIDQSLRTTLKDTSSDNKKYIMVADEVVESHLNDIIGTGSGANTTVQIIGQNHKIDGNRFKGVVVDNGQKIIVENVAEASGFAKTSDYGAFINVKSGGEAYITDSTIKGNTVNNDQGGAVYLHDGTLVLDGTTFDSNSATKTGSYGGSGGAIYNYMGTISEADGASQSTFTGNTAAAHGGAIGNVGYSNSEKSTIESLNAQFTNNSAGSNGGAIYNRLGDINNISGTFTANTAKNGGAIYNQSGTITISNATFTDNGSTENGGAVYNGNGTSSIIMSDVNFVAQTGTNQNDVYNEGTINVTDGTNTFASAVTNGGTMNVQGGTNTFSGDITTTGTMNFGGTNTISGAITATATGDNKINFTGTNTLTSTIAMTGNMALTNSGALELNSDLSAYTGNFTQTAGSTNVKSTATLFGGTNTVEGGTMALDGVLASNLDIQGGTVTSTTGTFAGTSATTVNGGTLQMDGGSVKGGATVDVYSGNMNFDGGNLENGSNTNVVGGTMTMNGGTMDDGSTVTVNSGTMNYQSGTVDGTLAVNDGNMNVQGDLTIKNNSYIYQDAKLTIDSGKTLTVKNLDSGNSVGVQLNNGDNWNGTVNVGANGILSVTDLVQSGNLIQTAGTSTFTNSVINMALSDVTGGNVNMFGSKLNYASGKTFAPDNLNLANQSTINMMNANPNDTLSLKNVSTTGTNNLTVDINPMAHKIDKVVINGDLNGVGAVKISDWNFMGKMPLDKNYKFKVVDVTGAINNVDFLATNKKHNTPIGTYQLKSNGGGTYTFGLTQYNPDIFRGQVATMAAYQNQVIIDNIILDQFVLHNHLYDKNDKQANRYASAQSLFAPYQHSKEEGGLWFRSYVDFETLTFKNNLSANNNSYGALVGADLPVVKLKHNWDFIPTFYVGYTGSSQSLNHNHMYQNGGQGGFMGTFIHNDFIGSVMAYGGGYNNEMHVGDETDHTGNWFAGTAAKAAYNLHATKHFIIQPTAFISYNIFGRQNWHTDLGSFGMNSGLLNGINVAPGLNLIYQRETWSAYATFQYMYNINDQVSGHAGNINLPALKMRHGYFQYGIGATKTWKDRLSSYFQFVIRNGGRTGIGFQLGAKYSFDWNLKPKSKSNLKSGSTQTQKTAGERTVIKSVK